MRQQCSNGAAQELRNSQHAVARDLVETRVHAPWLLQRRQGRTACMGPSYSAGCRPRRNENGLNAKAGSLTSPLSLILSCSLWALGGERVFLSKQCF